MQNRLVAGSWRRSSGATETVDKHALAVLAETSGLGVPAAPCGWIMPAAAPGEVNLRTGSPAASAAPTGVAVTAAADGVLSAASGRGGATAAAAAREVK